MIFFFVLIIPLISNTFSEKCYESNKSFDTFCQQKYFDSISWDGTHYRFHQIINESYSRHWTVCYNKTNDYFQIDDPFDFESYSKTQSIVAIPFTPNCDQIFNNCTEMKKLQNMRIKFYSFKGFQSYTIVFKNFTDNTNIWDFQYPYGLKQNDDISGKGFWPKNTEKSGQIHKPVAFWPNQFMFLYIFNGNHLNDKKSLAYSSMYWSNWYQSWRYQNIGGFNGLRFTSAFWWLKADKIYAVADNGSENRIGIVYELLLPNTGIELKFKKTNYLDVLKVKLQPQKCQQFQRQYPVFQRKLVKSMDKTTKEVKHYWNCSLEDTGICSSLNKTGEEKIYGCCFNKDSMDQTISRFDEIKDCDQKTVDEQKDWIKLVYESLLKGCPQHNRDVCEKLRSVRSNVTITTTRSTTSTTTPESFGLTMKPFVSIYYLMTSLLISLFLF